MLDSIAFFIVKISGWIAQLLPETVVRTISEAFALLIYFFDHRKKFAYANLKAAFGKEKSGKEIRDIVRLCYISLARTFAEILRFPKLDKKELHDRVVDEDPQRFGNLLTPRIGKGAIYVTGHLGNWELSQFVSTFRGFPLKVIARSQSYAKLNDLLNFYRAMAGTETIPRGMGIRDAFLALRKGEMLGFVQDQSGGGSGTYVRFFGRLTSFPIGAFKLARHSDVPAFPAFLIRMGKDRHRVIIEEPRHAKEPESKDQAVLKDLEHYVGILERCIRQYPDQWLWMHRRWKYTRTKFVTVLLDDKAGHASQSRSVLNLAKKTYSDQNAQNEIIVNEIYVRFKSTFHQWLAHGLTFLLLPWLQGRLGLITWTLEKDSAEAIERQYADVVISTGASMLPINAALAKECRAKKIVVMKPSFPYSLLRYEVALIPEHDRPATIRDSFYVDLAPNLVDKTLLTSAGDRIRKENNLPKGRYVAIFLGGNTKGYEMDLVKLDFALWEIRRVCEQNGFGILLTTSRRTPSQAESLVKKHFTKNPICPLLVIANEKNQEGIIYGMMDSAEAVIVTEDSISMISESIQSGKPALVLQVGRTHARPKYERFQQMLRLRNYAAIVTASELSHELSSVLKRQKTLNPCTDRERISRRLAGTL